MPNNSCLALLSGSSCWASPFTLFWSAPRQPWSGQPSWALFSSWQRGLRAGQHGAKTSSIAVFLEAVRPQVVVVSAGEDNRFGHPSPEVLERVAEVGAAVLRTDELGTIEVITDGQGIWWEATGE